MKFQFFSFLLFCGVVLTIGCSKDEFGSGSVKFINKSAYPYNLSINGASKGEISGGSFKVIELDAGTYSLKAEQVSGYIVYPTVKDGEITVQVSGYILYPTVKDGEITVRRDDFLEWSFP